MTTTALGLALTWPGRVLLAECDPMGRGVLPGFMADRIREPTGPGLLGVAMAAEADPRAAVPLEEYVMPIADDGRVELLHGVRDPRHGVRLAPLWPRLAEVLVERDGDVLADLGRVGGTDTPEDLLKAAHLVVMVLGSTLPQVDAAAPRLDALKELVTDPAAIGLCVIREGSYRASEAERVLHTPVLAELPCSPVDAAVLSDGARPRLTFKSSLLVRSLDGLGRRIRTLMATGSPDDHATGSPGPVAPAAGGRR
ncbi:hypothetical protein [Actinomadura macra]|uniref:hypothetical protein n=1 Tax=Actinomadura macra TaxID=46164 RepID=UPI0012F8CB90|nr:hypothetical protein [Actinomadura macra]